MQPSEAERRERAAAYWFNVLRPKLAGERTKPVDPQADAAARLMDLAGLSREQFDALPDAASRATFKPLRG